MKNNLAADLLKGTGMEGKDIDWDEWMKFMDEETKRTEAFSEKLTAMIAKLNGPTEPPAPQRRVIPQLIKTEAMEQDDAMRVLAECTVKDQVVYLPDTRLDRKIYETVKNRLELIGGHWKGGKVSGFVFQEDPYKLLQEIAYGKKVNLKKEYQFFGTPPALAAKMVQLANIGNLNKVLEPSAGQGAILEAIRKDFEDVRGNCFVDYYELMELNQKILADKYTEEKFRGADFMNVRPLPQYDKIVANPPFSKNQDLLHIRKMYDVLKPGGTMVTLSSLHWRLGKETQCVNFRTWLMKQVKAETEDIPPETFKESGTMVGAVLIKIVK